jgi:hypothetical protein
MTTALRFTNSPTRRLAHKQRGHPAAQADRTTAAVRGLQKAVDRLRDVIPASLCKYPEARRLRHDLGAAATIVIGIARGLRPESAAVPIQPASRTRAVLLMTRTTSAPPITRGWRSRPERHHTSLVQPARACTSKTGPTLRIHLAERRAQAVSAFTSVPRKRGM